MVTRVVFILLLAASASAQPAKNDYSDAKTWLCRPGRQDACAVDLTTTIVAANGSLKRVSARAGVPFRDADRVRDRVRLVPFDDPAAREQPVRSRPGENMQAVCANRRRLAAAAVSCMRICRRAA